LPAHNACFAGEPAGEGLAFAPIPGVDLDEILCVEEERQVGNDNCVSYRTLKLQIPESPMRPHFVKPRVKVHVYPGPCLSRRLARPLSPTTMHRPLRRKRQPQGRRSNPTRRLNPLGGAPTYGDVDGAFAPPTSPQEQNQKQRTIHALPKPDNFVRYRRKLFTDASSEECTATSHSRPPDAFLCRARGGLGITGQPTPKSSRFAANHREQRTSNSLFEPLGQGDGPLLGDAANDQMGPPAARPPGER
jgi:hypothetical protein